MSKKVIIVTAVILLILTAAFGYLSSNPVISIRADIPDTYLEAVEDQVKGVYSDKIPLVPFLVTVDSFSEDLVFYKIHYFPFGTVEMSYREGYGYNIEKPLTRIS